MGLYFSPLDIVGSLPESLSRVLPVRFFSSYAEMKIFSSELGTVSEGKANLVGSLSLLLNAQFDFIKLII